jgi:hypothetical protein
MVRRFRSYEIEALSTGERKQRQHIIAVTANRTEELAHYSEDGMLFDEILSKPVAYKCLVEVLQKYQ